MNINTYETFNKKYTLANAPKKSIKMLYSDVYEYNNGYFNDIKELSQYCKSNDIDMPEYIYGTTEKLLQMKASDIVKELLDDDEWYENAFNDVDSNALDNFQKACDIFCKKCGVGKCYITNYNVCIKI